MKNSQSNVHRLLSNFEMKASMLSVLIWGLTASFLVQSAESSMLTRVYTCNMRDYEIKKYVPRILNLASKASEECALNGLSERLLMLKNFLVIEDFQEAGKTNNNEWLDGFKKTANLFIGSLGEDTPSCWSKVSYLQRIVDGLNKIVGQPCEHAGDLDAFVDHPTCGSRAASCNSLFVEGHDDPGCYTCRVAVPQVKTKDSMKILRGIGLTHKGSSRWVFGSDRKRDMTFSISCRTKYDALDAIHDWCSNLNIDDCAEFLWDSSEGGIVACEEEKLVLPEETLHSGSTESISWNWLSTSSISFDGHAENSEVINLGFGAGRSYAISGNFSVSASAHNFPLWVQRESDGKRISHPKTVFMCEFGESTNTSTNAWAKLGLSLQYFGIGLGGATRVTHDHSHSELWNLRSGPIDGGGLAERSIVQHCGSWATYHLRRELMAGRNFQPELEVPVSHHSYGCFFDHIDKWSKNPRFALIKQLTVKFDSKQRNLHIRFLADAGLNKERDSKNYILNPKNFHLLRDKSYWSLIKNEAFHGTLSKIHLAQILDGMLQNKGMLKSRDRFSSCTTVVQK